MRFGKWIVALLILSCVIASQASAQERRLKRADLPPAVQKTADQESQGATVRGYSSEKNGDQLEYEVAMTVPEFTCLCPVTGQPDFATIRIRYVPDQHLVELKSLKLYLWSYRQEGAFHEDVTNRILNDLVEATRPRWAEVIGDFNVRGGIKTEVRATFGKRPEI